MCNSYPHTKKQKYSFIPFVATYSFHPQNAYNMKNLFLFTHPLNMMTMTIFAFFFIAYAFLHRFAWNWMTTNVQTHKKIRQQWSLEVSEHSSFSSFKYFCRPLRSTAAEFMKYSFFMQYFMNESLSTSLTLFIHFHSAIKTQEKKVFVFTWNESSTHPPKSTHIDIQQQQASKQAKNCAILRYFCNDTECDLIVVVAVVAIVLFAMSTKSFHVHCICIFYFFVSATRDWWQLLEMDYVTKLGMWWILKPLSLSLDYAGYKFLIWIDWVCKLMAYSFPY